jgi:hypothetical protein
MSFSGPDGRAVTKIEIVNSNPAQGMSACLCVSVLCCPVQVVALATGPKESYQVP